MNKAMFAGVAGLKTHQSKMDVIGNNIANVNTYGFKSQRAVFSDVYYQTLQGATGGTVSSGGTDPSSIGYGSMLAGVQTQMTTSSLQTTGYGLDVAIAGEGFLQVMDADGNIFYTKAGMLKYDSNGYLVDINGNFVLGATGSTADPGTQKIKLDDIGSVDSSVPSVEMTINGIAYEMKASNATSYGNVSITMASSQSLPSGLKASAEISATGSISVFLNAYEEFASMDEVNAAVNAAILEANGGVEHAAGTFTITSSENVFGSDATNASVSGSVTREDATITGLNFLGGNATVTSFTPEVVVGSVGGNTTFEVTGDADVGFQIIATVDGVEYTSSIAANNVGNLTLTSAGGGSISLDLDGKYFSAVELANFVTAGQTTAAANPPTYFLGGGTISSISTDFPYSGTLNFGITSATDSQIEMTIVVNNVTYTGTLDNANGGNVVFTTADPNEGSITMNFPSIAEMQSNVGYTDSTTQDFATMLGAVSTTTYHSLSAKAYAPAQSSSLTGAQIIGTAGGIDYGSVTGTAATAGFFGGIMTVKGVSSSFTGDGAITGDMFTATYYAEGEGTKLDGSVCDTESWEILLDIDGVTYRAVLADGEQAGSLLLQNTIDSSDYIEISNPGFSSFSSQFTSDGSALISGESQMQAFDTTAGEVTLTPSTESSNLGFGTSSFVLTGGTSGGTITLDQISNISIGSDGTIAVTHSEKGTVVAGKISLAVFANSAGLQLMGTNYYSATANSGEAILVDPGTGGSGSLAASALEMSNVDISNEFAEMITCQRGFQANSRIITVSDTMLEELINLKR